MVFRIQEGKVNDDDHDRHFDYKDRCGTWADFAMEG
jgi:hypothetical protein